MLDKLTEMREAVKLELKHIPKGDTPQNELRRHYWSLRMSSLGKRSKPKARGEVLKEAIEVVKKGYPSFVPLFDKKFFKRKRLKVPETML